VLLAGIAPKYSLSGRETVLFFGADCTFVPSHAHALSVGWK
jgi:hypothetical protein